jgi:hypothetical protein
MSEQPDSRPVTLSQLREATEAYHRSTGDAAEGRCLSSVVEDRYLKLLRLVGRAGLSSLPPRPELRWHELFLEINRSWAMVEGRLQAASPPEDKQRKRRSTNEDRDCYCYQQKKAGQTWRAIQEAVNNRSEWEPIDTEQGVSQAAKRYAERHDKPWPISAKQA